MYPTACLLGRVVSIVELFEWRKYFADMSVGKNLVPLRVKSRLAQRRFESFFIIMKGVAMKWAWTGHAGRISASRYCGSLVTPIDATRQGVHSPLAEDHDTGIVYVRRRVRGPRACCRTSVHDEHGPVCAFFSHSRFLMILSKKNVKSPTSGGRQMGTTLNAGDVIEAMLGNADGMQLNDIEAELSAIRA